MRARAGLLLAVALACGCGGASSDAPSRPASGPSRPSRGPGPLVLIGGESGPPDTAIYRTILGGRQGGGPLCVLPTASSAPTTVMERAQSALDEQGGAGTASTVFLALEDAERAGDPQLGAEIRRCSGFFFTDGEQSRMLDVLLPEGDTTIALRAILDRYRGGAVLAATGAAAMALGKEVIVAGESPSALDEGDTTVVGSDGLLLRSGLGVLPHAMIDSRFFSDGRIGRLLVALLESDSVRTGLGIDENTALVVDARGARVIGPSGVGVLDSRGALEIGVGYARNVRVTLAGSGDRLDLRSLSVTPATGKAPLAKGGRLHRGRDPLAPWEFLHAIGDLAQSEETEARLIAGSATLVLREADGFRALARSGEGVQREPDGLSAGPFLMDLLPGGGQ